MDDEERPASPLAIALFGSFDVRLQGCPLPRLHSQKTQWLLALLALQEGRAVERAWLAGTLWPDSAAQQAAFNLRRNLWHLRQSLGHEARRLEAPTTGTLRLNLVGAEADVLIFDEAIHRGDTPSLERAVALHRGPLLQGCEEDWVLAEREAREQAYLAALETLAAHASAQGEHGAAVRYLRRLIVADPLRDSAHRALMQALAAAGDLAAATQVYREFRLLLHRELNAAPDPETIDTYQQIQAAVRRRLAGRPGAPTAPPRRITVETTAQPPPSRLPQPLTRLVGREEEIREVCARLAVRRLVTLTGAGGVGKTRLAIQAADALAPHFPDGLCFVDLGALADPALVPQTVATTLGVREQGDRPLTGTLQEALLPRKLLLVLDNCEHLLSACALLADALLAAAPHLHILATSRQPLGLSGEIVWRVPSLSLPPVAPAPGARCQVPGPTECQTASHSATSQPGTWHLALGTASEASTAALLQFDAVRLFVERAQAAVPAFALTEQNAPAVVQLCRRLDGIPLAIELAAARLNVLSVEQMAVRLDDRFRLLTRGSRTALPRHQTLQAAMEWSYDLLSEPERTLLRRLSVFAGGWTLEAAEAVCAEEDRPTTNDQRPTNQALPDVGRSSLVVGRYDVLDLLTALVEKSLVQFEAQEDGGRYRFLETVREYARDRLEETGEAPTVRNRHLSYFRRQVEEAESKLSGEEQGVWLDRLEREHDNLHAAIDWSLTDEEGCKEGLALILELLTYWDLRSRFGEAREYLKRFTDRCAEWPIDMRARLLHLAGLVATKQADYPAARRYFEEIRALQRQHSELNEDPSNLQCYGALALHEGDYAQAAAFVHEGLRLFREAQQAGRPYDRFTMAWTVDLLGLVAYYQGDFPSARSFYEQSLRLSREMEAQTGIASALLGLGRTAAMQGDYGAARALLDESLSLFRGVKVKHSTIEVLNSLARICWLEGDYPTARAHLVAALVMCRETGRYVATIDTLIAVGHLSQRQDNPGRAVRLFGAAAALRDPIGQVIQAVERAEYEASIAAARAALGEEAFAAAWAEGWALSMEQAVRVALEEDEIPTAGGKDS